MSVKEGTAGVGSLEGLDDPRRYQRSGQRQHAAGQRLGGAHQIRYDAGRLVGPKRAGPPTARHYLVDNEEHIMLVSDFSNRAQGLRRVHPHPAGPLYERLNDDAGDLISMLAQVLIEPRGIDGQDIGLEQERLEAAEEHGIAADRHGAERVAVIAVLEADETRPPRLAVVAPELVRHLEGDFDRGAAVVGVKNAAAFPAEGAKQPL